MNLSTRVSKMEAAASPKQYISIVFLKSGEPFEDRTEAHGGEVWLWRHWSKGMPARQPNDPHPKVYLLNYGMEMMDLL